MPVSQEDPVAAVPSPARRLHLAFEDPKAFQHEYASNLARGGAFVATSDAFELREVVEVLLEAGFAGEKLVLMAEVVHCAGSGVAVQFLDSAPELRSRLEALVEGADRSIAEAAEESIDDDIVIGPADDEFGGIEIDDDSFDLDVAGAEAPARSDAATKISGDGDPNERTFRARAERSPMRVVVQVKGPTGKAFAARTRDLSPTGLLVSVDGEELPIGREVTVELTHPTTGEKLEVPAKVVRHIQGEGVVPAVALAFQPGAKAADIERFVVDLKQVDAERQRGGIRGPLEELGGASMLQMFAALSKQGTLTVTHGAEEGVVAFANGMLGVAQVGSVMGVKALARILSWRDGFFEFRSHVDPLGDAQAQIPMEGAILDALRLLDESNRLSIPQLPASARLEIARDQLATIGQPIGQTEQAVLELAAAGFTVRRILDVIPENDAAIRSAITALLDSGILRLV
jgi:Tfp pilus assembly protein PilZ